MRKLNKLFLMGAATLALGLTACDNNETFDPAEEGKMEANTYVAVSLYLPTGSTAGIRGLPSDYNDVGQWAGKDGINSVDVYLVDASTSTVTHESFTAGQYASEQSNPNLLKPNKAIKTTAGAKSVYVLVNATNETRGMLDTNSPGAFVSSYKAVLALDNSGSSQPVSTSAGKLAEYENEKDNILMTCPKETFINLEAGVTEQEAITGTKNRATVDVERAVARVMVTTSKDTESDTYDLGGLGEISDVKWVLAQGENSLYLQRKTDYMTPAYLFTPNDNNYYNPGSEAAAKYDYSGLFENFQAAPAFGGTRIPQLDAYKALNQSGNNKNEVLASLGLDDNIVNGKFILPTTHEKGNYKKGNTAYVLVRAKFTPNQFADGGTAPADGTFYMGANGLFYTSKDNARDETKNGIAGQVVYTYVGGKVLYYAWVNPDNLSDLKNSPVVRNNIYHIHITGFRTIGANWNPLYPDDPTNPDPNPDPENPGPVDPTDPLTTDTWMSVDINVLQWDVHSYALEL